MVKLGASKTIFLFITLELKGLDLWNFVWRLRCETAKEWLRGEIAEAWLRGKIAEEWLRSEIAKEYTVFGKEFQYKGICPTTAEYPYRELIDTSQYIPLAEVSSNCILAVGVLEKFSNKWINF